MSAVQSMEIAGLAPSEVDALVVIYGPDVKRATLMLCSAVANWFGSEFRSAGPAIEQRYRFAETLTAAGILERRIIELTDDSGRARGSRTEFRRVQQ